MGIPIITENAKWLYNQRYLLPGETIDGLFNRVAGGNEDFVRLMSDGLFLPNSPALFNLGTNNGCTSSACFVFDIDDEMGPLHTDSPRSIVNTRAKAIAVAKAGGGVGYYLGNIRGQGSPIRSIHRKACGPVGVLKDMHAISGLITQGGKRELAQMAVLPSDHLDVYYFIHCKDEDPQGLGSFNISVSWTDDNFSKAQNSKTTEFNIFNEQVKAAWSHGCPGILFHDEINNQKGNPNKRLGVINATNPCVTGETPILTRSGWVRIDSQLDKECEVWNGQEWSKVTPRITGRNADIVRVNLNGDNWLNCTLYHGFYLEDGRKVSAIELKPGDKIERFGNCDTIVSVMPMGKADTVYCFTEPKRGRAVFNGVLTAQCGETPNRSDEPCNLGSLVLYRFVNLKTRKFDFDRLANAASTSTSFLDDILDRNTFPHPLIDAAARLTRKLGLGAMGWADTLALMGIHYDTQEAVQLAEQISKIISVESEAKSRDIAKQKGPYAGYSYTETDGPCVRNETRTSIAPTGSISILANASSSIEPHYLLEWNRTTSEGQKLTERIAVWNHLNGFVPKTAGEIDWKWHIRHQAAWQKNVDLGVSKTINLPKNATVEDVAGCYRMMYDMKCKGGTIFRDGCRDEQVLTSTKTKSVFLVKKERRELPAERKSLTHKFRAGDVTCFVTVGMFEDGEPAEIFLRASRLGSPLSGMLDSWAIAFSVALQNGTKLEDLCKHHIGTTFEPNGMTGSQEIPTCTSIQDYVCRWLLLKFDGDEEAVPTDSGVYCPSCGASAVYSAGCLECSSKCGWNRCG